VVAGNGAIDGAVGSLAESVAATLVDGAPEAALEAPCSVPPQLTSTNPTKPTPIITLCLIADPRSCSLPTYTLGVLDLFVN